MILLAILLAWLVWNWPLPMFALAFVVGVFNLLAWMSDRLYDP